LYRHVRLYRLVLDVVSLYRSNFFNFLRATPYISTSVEMVMLNNVNLILCLCLLISVPKHWSSSIPVSHVAVRFVCRHPEVLTALQLQIRNSSLFERTECYFALINFAGKNIFIHDTCYEVLLYSISNGNCCRQTKTLSLIFSVIEMNFVFVSVT